jgi:hypothetical protein
MLLLDVDTGDETLAQGFVRARWPAGDQIAAGQVTRWIRLFLRSTILWSQARPLSAALRLSAQPGRPLTTVHSFVVPKTQEERLRLVLAAFLRTNQMGGAETDVPQQEADLTGVFIHPDETRMGIRYERLRTAQDVSIHFNLRLAEQLPRIIETFVDLGVPVAYEAQVTPWSPPRELLRAVLYDTARLEQSRAAPLDLVRDQRVLAERLKRAAQQRPAYHVEECLATAAGAPVDALGESMANLLSGTLYGSFGAAPQLASLGEKEAEAFSYHVHSHLMHGPPHTFGAESAASAATKDDVDRLLSCRSLMPVGISAGGVEPPGTEPLFTTLTGSTLAVTDSSPGEISGPKLETNLGPYLFISYARNDGDIVYPLIEDLLKRGVSMWFDRRILGGDDWVAELEARLISCTGVVALISPSFELSKYCPREVHFADALNRPIIPVLLHPTPELARGLKFLLNRLQIIDFHRTQSIDGILASIKQHTPATWAGPVQ